MSRISFFWGGEGRGMQCFLSFFLSFFLLFPLTRLALVKSILGCMYFREKDWTLTLLTKAPPFLSLPFFFFLLATFFFFFTSLYVCSTVNDGVIPWLYYR
ncbi:hypothetical protein B0F90DRAFT_1720146 [Multifurca ochricompacta]|uniref:Uncharacterized protein n=1 Tax=Multifurca ochricompacta TaxID=376703 RepID=A0AAD4QNS5_9AGAM|nr:hypothetical protein B0F90DRAFT_1720146 [Multifurca ochricompacta]